MAPSCQRTSTTGPQDRASVEKQERPTEKDFQRPRAPHLPASCMRSLRPGPPNHCVIAKKLTGKRQIKVGLPTPTRRNRQRQTLLYIEPISSDKLPTGCGTLTLPGRNAD